MTVWWQPSPKIERHGEVFVVRDDLVPGGSKMRFLPYLVKDAKEIVFGGPFCGGAPYALSEWGKRTNAKVTLFYAKRKNLHPRQKAAFKNGANIYQVPFGYMSNVQAKAKKYAAQAGALFLPLGFDVPEASEPFISQMREAMKLVGSVDEIWACTGSGMLARCLGKAFPNTPVKGVIVGLKSRNQKQQFGSNVELIEAPYLFAQETKVKPPFDSCANYDAKAWELMQKIKPKTKSALFWNVLGNSSLRPTSHIELVD